jgi:hypothetical protein
MGNTTGWTVRQRADLYLSTRIAQLVTALPGLEHFERSDYVRDLEVLEQNLTPKIRPRYNLPSIRQFAKQHCRYRSDLPAGSLRNIAGCN